MKTGIEPADSGLKYSKLVTTGSSEPGTIKVRYKEPLEDVSHGLEKVIEIATASFTDRLFISYALTYKAIEFFSHQADSNSFSLMCAHSQRKAVRILTVYGI